MKRKRNSNERLEVFLLAVLFFVQAILGILPVRTVQAAANVIEVWDENAIMDYGHRFNMKYQPGITEVVTFGCDNQDKEAFTNHGKSGREVDTRRMTGAYESESAGVRYYNVGCDGQGNIVDFKLSVVSVENPEPRYDMQTVIYKYNESKGNGDSSGAFDWEDNIGQPLVAFALEEIGMFIYCVDSVKVHFQFLKHNTEEPLPISGHGTVRDIDACQGVFIPPDSGIDNAYIVKGNDFLTVDGMTVTGDDPSIEPGDKRGWLNLLYNTESVYFDFVHKVRLEMWDTNREEGIARYGSPEKWAEVMRKKYVDSDGNSFCPNFDGGKTMRGYAYFDFTSYCFGGIEMGKNPEKRVGESGCTWEEAVVSGRENPFLIKENEEFQYMVQTEITPNQFEYFIVKDTLEDCFVIEDVSKVQVISDTGQDVTEQFDILLEGQTITCSAKAEYLTQESFTNNRIYTFSFRVHRRADADIAGYLDSDGYSIIVPNSATMSYQRINGTGDSVVTEPVWVRSIIPPELTVKKEASQYEWSVGDVIDYTVTVAQEKANTRAVQVVVEDVLPPCLRLMEGEYYAEVSPGGESCAVAGNGQNGWQVQCPVLRYGEVLTIRFRCLATEESNGQEWSNIVSATAENLINPDTGERKSVKDIAEIWMNSPELEIDKTADKYEWNVGDEVSYRIVVNNSAPGTIAKDVTIADIGLPEGLVLSGGEQSIEILDVLQQVDYPVPDKKTGQVYETLPVEAYLEADERGFSFYCSYLPYSYPVTVLFHCTAAEEANGRESVNAAVVRAGNAGEKSDDGEVYVNTGEFRIEKMADHYEWQLGELVEYTVTVENIREGTIARNVTVWDNNMPAGLALASPDSVSVAGIPQSIIQPVAGTPDVPGILNPEFYQETEEKQVSYELLPEGTGWRLEISDLPAGVPVAVTFFCTVTEEVNGTESINEAGVQAENVPGQTDDTEIYVNTAALTIDKTFRNPYLDEGDGREPYEFRVGELVEYQVTVDNIQEGSIARNLVISDLSLPEGLIPDEGEDALTVSGIPQTVPDPAGEKEVVYEFIRQGTGWLLTISDLPYHMPVTVNFRCTAQETINGMEVINTASAYAENAVPVKDAARIWVNSPVLGVSKKADKSFCKNGDIVTYRVKLTQEQPGCVARNVVLNDVIESPGMRLVEDSIVLRDENGNRIEAAAESNGDNEFEIVTGRNLVKHARYSIYDSEQGGITEQVMMNPLDIRGQKQMVVEYRTVVTEENPEGQMVHNIATANSQENIPSSGEEKVEVVPPAPTATPMPTATPRPTAVPSPRPTAACCPKLTPAPTKIPSTNYNNSDKNAETPSKNQDSGNLSGGYQANSAKTGDARPFERVMWIGVAGVLLMTGGILMYRRSKKAEDK